MARIKHDWLIYSTQTNNTDYVEYERTLDDNKPVGPARIKRKVTIKGGANRSQKKTLITPLGVMTGVTNAEMEFLNNCVNFQRHKKAGFITVIKGSGWPDDPDDIAKDMAPKDGSAPLDAGYYTKRGKEPPLVGAETSSKTPSKRSRSKSVSAFR